MARRIGVAVLKKKLWRPDLDVNANLRRTLPKLTRAFFKRGNHALLKERDWPEIHAFRIATKRFRYTLELFASNYGPGIETRLNELRELQTLLGDANDFIVTAALLEKIDGTEAVRSQLTGKAEAKVRNARTWWRGNMGTEAAEQRWVSYFQRSVARMPAPAQPGPTRGAVSKVR